MVSGVGGEKLHRPVSYHPVQLRGLRQGRQSLFSHTCQRGSVPPFSFCNAVKSYRRREPNMSPTASRRKPKTSRVRKLRVPRQIVAPPRHPSMSDKMDAVLQEEAIQAFLETHENIAPAAINAVKLILEKNLEAPMHEVVRTLRRVIETLARRKVKVFFSYKAKDEEVAEKIANKLSSWSAEKLDIQGMQRFAEEQAGQEWRKKILTTIQECDCFLLLLPSPGEQGDERDWVLLEAGYYFKSQDL